MAPLVETYLASLPSGGRTETWRDIGVERPSGVVERTVYKGLEDKARVQLILSGDFEWSRVNRYQLGTMVSALRMRLRGILREDLGGVYGVSVGSSTSRWPSSEYQVTIGFACAPDQAATLTAAVFSEIERFKREGVDSELLEKVIEAQRRQRETQLKENGFWLRSLRFSYFHDEDPNLLLDQDGLIDKLSRKKVREAARKYLDEKNYVKVVLMPEAARPEQTAALGSLGGSQ
jgi:zinc protease